MINRNLIATALIVPLSLATVWAQNTNSSTTVRPRTTASPSSTNRSNDSETTRSIDAQKSSEAAPPAAASKPAVSKAPGEQTETGSARAAAPQSPGSATVADAFNTLLNGIRKADVQLVSNSYWNSPRLLLFNNNGSVTRGWAQMRSNRESSYKDVKDVKLDVRDVSITMLGRDAAVVTSQWTQSQTYKGTPETATGRMTLVFRRVGRDWKAIHLHTSPDRPDPSRVLPSEQTTPTPNP